MSEYKQMAMDFAQRQATVRAMSGEEYVQLINETEAALKRNVDKDTKLTLVFDPKEAIKPHTVICCVCGQPFKVLTKKHLASHGLTPPEYRKLCGYTPKQALAARQLVRMRQEKMKEMRLWERRGDDSQVTKE